MKTKELVTILLVPIDKPGEEANDLINWKTKTPEKIKGVGTVFNRTIINFIPTEGFHKIDNGYLAFHQGEMATEKRAKILRSLQNQEGPRIRDYKRGFRMTQTVEVEIEN